MIQKYDCLGKPLNEGDFVLRSSSKYKGIFRDVIIRFTTRLVHTKSGHREYPRELVKITEKEYKSFVGYGD